MRRFFSILLWTILLAALIAALIFLGRKHDEETTCEDFELSIQYDGKDALIEEEAIREMILLQTDTLIGQSLSEIDMQAIKNVLDAVPYIKEANIHRGIKGRLTINISLREPVLRIINKNNISYYIDEEGYLIPLNPGHPARVIIMNGNILDGVTKISQQMHLDSLGTDSTLRKLHTMATHINASPFLSKLIGQVWIDDNKEIELTPLVGEYTIHFGGFEDMENKFFKLETFYHEGAGKTGWIDYKSIDLRYKNQVICSKK